MAREPTDIDVSLIVISDEKAKYILAAHGVRRLDVLAAFGHRPRYFVDRLGRYAMVGQVPGGRFLLAAIMVIDAEEGMWRLITAHWLDQRVARRVYGREEQ